MSSQDSALHCSSEKPSCWYTLRAVSGTIGDNMTAQMRVASTATEWVGVTCQFMLI